MKNDQQIVIGRYRDITTTIQQKHRLELDGKNDTMPEQNHLVAAENKALKIQIEEQNRTMLDQKRLAEAEIQTLNFYNFFIIYNTCSMNFLSSPLKIRLTVIDIFH